jgi:hypothetical protein
VPACHSPDGLRQEKEVSTRISFSTFRTTFTTWSTCSARTSAAPPLRLRPMAERDGLLAEYLETAEFVDP